MRLSRADRSIVTEWWFTVDRTMLGAFMALVVTGIVLSLAASPAVAIKKGLAPYHFVERHLLFALAGFVTMLAASMLPPRGARRLALGVMAAGIAGLLWVHAFGEEINGARRWLSLAGFSLQPSELLKPAFVVVSAWLLAEARSRPEMPGLAIAASLLGAIVLLLVMQPDVGQTMLVVFVWGALFFLSGQPVALAGAGAAAAFAGLFAAYHLLPHVQSRIDRFIHPDSGDTYQIDRAMQSFVEGGFLGRGPGEGTIKSVLPDAHTDFIFAVVAEEYGAVACMALVAIFAFVVLRAFARASEEPEAPTRLAIAGLALLLGLQALINMGVNVGLLPAKGMTLPFISAGGSSMIAASLGAGLLLSLTRRRVAPERLKKPRLGPNLGGLEMTGSMKL